MFHLELTDIQKYQKIDTMGIWKILYSVTLNPLRQFYSFSNVQLNQCDPDRTIIEHDNGFTMVNTRLFEPGTDPYVIPSQCEQVFYSYIPGKAGWSFVVRHDPRGRLVKYNLEDGNEEDSLEEEDDGEEHDQHELGDDDDPT